MPIAAMLIVILVAAIVAMSMLVAMIAAVAIPLTLAMLMPDTAELELITRR